MYILYHHRTRAEDAQGVHIGAMVSAFRVLGHTVEVVSPLRPVDSGPAGAAEPAFSRLARTFPPWLYETMSVAYNIRGYQRLSERIRARRPDFLYERYALNTLCGIWASRQWGIPLVLEVNAPLRREQAELGALAFARLARWTERWVCSNSTVTLVVTEVMRRMLVDDGVPASQLVVMPNGVDPREFNPQVSGDLIRRRHGLSAGPVVGFVGWFRPWHGLDRLVRAMHEAGLFDRGTHLLLVGDGPARYEVERYARRHGLERHVVLTGPVSQEEVPMHIAAMDVAVQPSATPYACPMKLIEYMAMGRCVLAPCQPNICEVVRNGETGSLFDPTAPASLAACLRALIENPSERQRLGSAAAEAVHERGLLWTANAGRVINLALRRKPGGSPCD